MLDLLKFILLIIVLAFVYNALPSENNTNTGWNAITGSDAPLQATEEELWGSPSPLRGTVLIGSISTPKSDDPTQEYIYISAPNNNNNSIDLTGWSLRSVVSDTRVYLPPATLILKMTEVNDTRPVHLAPGEYAVLNTGYSPISNIATSFHTNACIGYISEFYEFVPELESQCNNPKTSMPPTPQNVKTYGATCIDFLQKAEPCKSYTNEMPKHLLPACKDFIARNFTYHHCLSGGINSVGYDVFNNGGWYLYLNHSAELWRNNYEAIQLLDPSGLVVDVLQY